MTQAPEHHQDAPASPVPVSGEVQVAGAVTTHAGAADFGAAFTLTFTGNEGPLNLLPYDVHRAHAYITVQPGNYTTVGAVTTPAVPGNGVAFESPYGFPVQVVISGGTLSQVTINNVIAGGGDGTYFLPAYGIISIAYTAAPAWAWTAAAAEAGPVYIAYRDPSGLVAVRANGLMNGQAPVYVLGAGITLAVAHKQAVWIAPDGTHPATVSVSVERWET